MIIRKIDYKFCSLNSPLSTTHYYLTVISVIVYVLRQNCRAAGWRWDSASLTLENTTRAAHLWYSNSSVGDIRDSTTKIIDITLPARGIISDKLFVKCYIFCDIKNKNNVDFTYICFYLNKSVKNYRIKPKRS
jgi:hypothetical protein